MTVALVTGGQGWVGGHLRSTLRGHGWDVVTLGRTAAPDTPGERHVVADLGTPDGLDRLLDGLRPDVVIHLAASGFRGDRGAIERLVADTVIGTHHLLTSARTVGLQARVVIAGSSAQYGAVPRSANPVTEDTLGRPVGPYGHAKAAAEALALALATDAPFELIPVRPFNHIGPGESATTVAGAFAERIAAVQRGQATRVTAADLAAVRDFTDVRDVAAGYLAVAERGQPGRTYNLCSGRAVAVLDVLAGLLAAAGLDDSVVDVTPGNPGSIPYQVGSPERITRDTGWSATTPLAASLADLLVSVRGPAGST